MRRWALVCALVAWAVPASAQNCVTINGVTRCAAPWQIYDTTVRQLSLPVIDLRQTWNAPGVTFTGWKINITDTNSASGSMLLDLQVGGVSKFSVSKAGAVTPASVTYFPSGTALLPSLAFASDTTTGLYRAGASSIGFAAGGTQVFATTSAGTLTTGTVTINAGNVIVNNGGVFIAPVQVTAGTDSTGVSSGDLTRLRYSTTITPASGGAGNCGAAFLAAALTADCTIATLPAGMKLVSIYADVTVGLTCSGTCTGTKTIGAGKTAGGVEILAAGLNVAVATTTAALGMLDADLGTAMVRSAAIQGGYLNSWSATTPVIVRFTSGTGNWGSGAATFVNAGSVKFTLLTEQVK